MNKHALVLKILQNITFISQKYYNIVMNLSKLTVLYLTIPIATPTTSF